MPDDIRTAISTNVQGPKVVSQDDTRVEQHDPDKQIEADQYLSSDNATAHAHRGLRMTRLTLPGASS